MKTQDLIGPALDWAVAKCEGVTILPKKRGGCYVTLNRGETVLLRYSTDWSQGGPIIEREGIDLHHHRHGDLSVGWDATIDSWDSEHSGPTPLVAAMRAYVASVLGDTVEIPEAIAC